MEVYKRSRSSLKFLIADENQFSVSRLTRGNLGRSRDFCVDDVRFAFV